jgi:RimJ/RimL family protein N-acetyltransferase
MDELRTASLLLRAPRESDIADIAGYRNDPRIAEHDVTFSLPYTPNDAANFVRNARLRAEMSMQYEWVMELQGRAIGTIRLGLADNRGEVGGSVAFEHWNRGFTTEALEAVAAYAARIGVDRLYALVLEENRGSVRMLEKARFRRTDGGARVEAGDTTRFALRYIRDTA